MDLLALRIPTTEPHMPRATKPQVRKTIRHNLTAPGPIQAAQIALVLMQVAKSTNWAGVVAETTLAQRVQLTPEQQQLLEEHRGYLPYLTRGGNGGTLRSLLACPTCGRTMFIGSASAPSKCQMTLGCEGSPIKAKSTQEPAPKDESANAATAA